MANLLKPDVCRRNLTMLVARLEKRLDSRQNLMPLLGFSLKTIAAYSLSFYDSCCALPFIISATKF